MLNGKMFLTVYKNIFLKIIIFVFTQNKASYFLN